MNVLKGDLMVGVLGDLTFQPFQAGRLQPIIGADNLPGRSIGHTENQPTRRLAFQISLVAQGGKVSAQVIKVEVALGLLELRPFWLSRKAHQLR
jgi:hypothetical protein